MFSNFIRILLISLSLIVAGLFFYFQIYILSVFTLGLTLYLLWSYFKQGTVALAASYYRKKNFEKCEQLLGQIKNPDRLMVKRRGFYEFMLGNIALKKENAELAFYHFQMASAFPLSSQNDKAYVLLHLANLSLRKGEKEKVFVYLNKAKDLKITTKVAELINTLEKEAKSS